jgi:hypothetical protein
MSEAKTGNARELTVHETHFPKIVVMTAAACWGLSVLGAILETVLAH